jgi:TrpR family transcriptional regulator, trp operon repressor
MNPTVFQEFLQLCTHCSSVAQVGELFDLFLTLEEKEMVAKRYLIIKVLSEGFLTQREIAEKYNVSISQITRGSNALKMISPKLKKFLVWAQAQ